VLKKKSFTLIEIIIVIIIIALLAALALPGFGVTRERTLDKEAKTSLLLMRAAERIYNLEMGFYFPSPAASTTDVSLVNANLKLRLPATPKTIYWNYNVDSVNQQINATRNKTGGRSFAVTFGSDTITCTPNSDTCP